MPTSSDPKKLHIGTEATEEKFAGKMHEMDLQHIEQETQVKAARLGMQYIYLVGIPIPPGPLSLISEEDAKQYKVICFEEKQGERDVAVVNPDNKETTDFLTRFASEQHARLVIYVMSETSLASVLKLYASIPKILPEVAGIEITDEAIARYGQGYSDIRKLNEQIQGVNLTEILTLLIAVGLQARASDIHVEAEEVRVVLRLRIDGVLHEVGTLPIASWQRIISRIKLISGVKINITDRPQDGRFTIFLKNDKIDVRVSTLPTSYGESVVMRLLRSSAAGMQFDQLGLHEHVSKVLAREIAKPNGMIMTTGPTGSGKTTTLYAILNQLNSPEVKIITLEDPVEYKLQGVNQSQVDVSRGYTFAAGLRSILRQDPDIVMVGEIRDLETADIAINAALTGHLVLSTIHTNSAAAAIPRFLAMGVKGFLLAPALTAVIGQRLVRRLCSNCKVEVVLDAETEARVKGYLSSIPPTSGVIVDFTKLHFFGPKGCDDCNGIGYKGRIGVYEVMTMNQEIEQNILSEKVSEYIIEEVAVKGGMITMVQDGLLWASEGVTSVEEVFSIAPQ